MRPAPKTANKTAADSVMKDRAPHARPLPRGAGRKPRVAVIGSGVSGMTTALALRWSGCDVTILAGQPWPETTSAVAAAFWYPFRVGGYRPGWAANTYAMLRHLTTDPTSGCSVLPFREYFVAGQDEFLSHPERFWWSDLPAMHFSHVRDCSRSVDFGPDDPLGLITFASFIEFHTVVVRMPNYLSFLEQQLRRAEVDPPRSQWQDSVDSLFQHFDAVVNCAGFAAAELDPHRPSECPIQAVSGQVIRTSYVPLEYGVSMATGPFLNQPLYVVPRRADENDVILGGSTISVDHPPRQPLPPADPELGARIWRRCTTFEPRIKQARIIEQLVGLRPVAAAVRVERDPYHSQPLFHNYGHGGGGVTLSWGTAWRIADLVTEAMGLPVDQVTSRFAQPHS
jgi:D-amino-acid oxidase